MATGETISALVNLAQADIQQDDLLVIVDVHDQDQGPAGSTKNVTLSAALATTMDAANLTAGIIPPARITGTGVLTAGSIAGGFGPIDVGTDPISGGTLTAATDSDAGHFVGNGATAVPTINGSFSPFTFAGTDARGTILLHATATATGSVLTVTFARAYASAPVVVLTPMSAPTLDLYVTSTTTSFSVSSAGNYTSGQNYTFGYTVTG